MADFEKITLAPGQSQVVTLYAHLHAMLHNPSGRPADRRVRLGRYRWSLLGQEFDGVGGTFDVVP